MLDRIYKVQPGGWWCGGSGWSCCVLSVEKRFASRSFAMTPQGALPGCLAPRSRIATARALRSRESQVPLASGLKEPRDKIQFVNPVKSDWCDGVGFLRWGILERMG